MLFNLSFFKTSLITAIPYIPVTLALAVVPLIFGLFFGIIIATVRIYRVPVLSEIFHFFVTFYSGIPNMVALLLFNLIYITRFTPVENGGLIVVLIVFTLDRVVYLSETIRSAYLSVPKGQYEAAYSVGMTELQTLRKIIIPQMIPVALPSMTSHIVGAIKNTSIVMVVGVYDVLNSALKPCMDTYSFIEGYIAAAVIFWVINAFVEFVFSKFEKKLKNKKNGEKSHV
ncbi:MAG: ABC transporter permease subunit [Spirochaetales bacterium]|nr:ABC transporter permease subunit [Spirochaetales bacterium]